MIVALFATGVRLDRRLVPREWRTTALLLGAVMPITIAAVAVYGVWAMGLSAGAAVVLGAALAPTDPVLAGELGVGPPGEGDEAEPHFALTSEAGLNDGLAFPFLLLGLVIAGGASAPATSPVAGGGRALRGRRGRGGRGARGAGYRRRGDPAARARPGGRRARRLGRASGRSWRSTGSRRCSGATASSPPSSGGISFRRRERDHEYNRGVHAGAETLERVLELAMILLLGSLLTSTGSRRRASRDGCSPRCCSWRSARGSAWPCLGGRRLDMQGARLRRLVRGARRGLALLRERRRGLRAAPRRRGGDGDVDRRRRGLRVDRRPRGHGTPR